MILQKALLCLFLFTNGICLIRCDDQINNSTLSSKSLVFRILAQNDPKGNGDVCHPETFDQDDRESASGISHLIRKFRKTNPLLDFIQTKHTDTTNKEFASKYIHETLPYASFALSLLLIPFFILICSCCRCECIGFYFSLEETKKYPLLIFTAIFTISILIASSFGIHYSNSLDTSLKSMDCSGQALFSDLSQGGSDLKWIGLEPAISNLTTVNKNILQSIASLPQVDNNHTNLDTLHTQFQSQVQTYYDKSSDQKVINPSNGESLVPIFIQNLGPPSNVSTYSGAISKENENKYTLVTQLLNDTNSSITQLQSEPDTIQTIIDDIIADLSSFDASLANIHHHFNNAAISAKQVNGIAKGIFSSLFIASTVLMSLILLVVSNLIFFQFNCFQKCFRFLCIFLVLLILFSFVTVGAGVPYIIFVREVCDATNKTFTNQTLYSNFVSSFIDNSAQFLNYTNPCLFQDGDLLNTFGVENNFSGFNTISDSINTINTNILPVPDSVIIPEQVQILQFLKNGESFTNPEINSSLISLNKFTNYQNSGSTQPCHESEDIWVLNHVNCTNTTGKVLKSTDAPTSNYKKLTCIGFDIFKSLNSTDRYNYTTFAKCPNVAGQNFSSFVSGFASSFQNHTAQVSQVFTQLSTNLGNANKTNTKFIAEQSSLLQPLLNIDAETLSVVETLGSSQNGLIMNMNCSFAQNSTQNLADNICVYNFPSLFWALALALIFAILASFMIIPLKNLDKIERKHLKDKHRQEESLLRIGDLY